ncbi:MAG: hypothetical protein WBE76_03300 [Terracidiphilus sp.]
MPDPFDPRLITPIVPYIEDFNPNAQIPYGVTIGHICKAMSDFVEFLRMVDTRLVEGEILRLEEMLMPANFSSMVGEFIASTLPKYCPTIVKNVYHNGHPDILPAGKYPRNSAQHAGADGIEIKASRYLKSWQGHNQEEVWLMVFAFEGGRPRDLISDRPLVQFRFLAVYGAMLEKSDWLFAGRTDSSRRTITASVLPIGHEKMIQNWIYKAPVNPQRQD